MLEFFNDYIGIKKIEEEKYNAIFLDYNYQNQPLTVQPQPTIGLNVFQKYGTLTKKIDIEEIKKDFITTAKTLAEKNYDSCDLEHRNRYRLIHGLTNRQVISKVISASNWIAYNGRFGPATVIITSEEIYKKYELNFLNHVKFYPADIQDIILLRKNEIDHPGFILLHTDDKYVIETLGLNPQFQFIIIKNKMLREKKLKRILQYDYR
jgi:hypothetical protein